MSMSKALMEMAQNQLDENKNIIKLYQDMKAQGKKDNNILDYIVSMPKYKRMTRDQIAKIIGDAKRKGIFKESVELDEATVTHKFYSIKHWKNGDSRFDKLDDLLGDMEYKHSALGNIAKNRPDHHIGIPTKATAAIKFMNKHAKSVNESIELDEAVTVQKKKYNWGLMMTVKDGNANSFPLHPEEQEKIRNLKDGQTVKFKDETGEQVTATRKGDTVHLSNKGSNKKTPVAYSQFNESVRAAWVPESIADEQVEAFMEAAVESIAEGSDTFVFEGKAYKTKKREALDPVGKADADIDNDGDVDSSDEYLHKRRKAIKKSMKDDEKPIDESKSSSGYELYHPDFSSAMQHAYKHAKAKLGVDVDPEEIDRKVAMGPSKPSKGKTNSYRLLDKNGKKAIHVQVYGMDNGKYELNMYKESVDLEEAKSVDYGSRMTDAQKKKFHDLKKKMTGGPEYQKIMRKNQSPVKSDDEFHNLVLKKVMSEAKAPGATAQHGVDAKTQDTYDKQLATRKGEKDFVDQHTMEVGMDIEKITDENKKSIESALKQTPARMGDKLNNGDTSFVSPIKADIIDGITKALEQMKTNN